ncbi:MAG: hypothetical protein ACYC5Y_12250 [Symbiobacteriia bacterium]
MALGPQEAQGPELGGGLPARQLFLQGEVLLLRGDEDGVPVGVEGDRDAVAAEDVHHEPEIADQVLMGPEKSGHDLAGGVIDGTDEGKGRGVVAEPVVVAAVDEEHEAGLGR